MYIIKNIVEDKIVGEFITDLEFILFVQRVAIENDDESISITTTGEAKDYLKTYSSNLTLTEF